MVTCTSSCESQLRRGCKSSFPLHTGTNRTPHEVLARVFDRACNDDGIPLVWLQDIAGFDIGVERLGLLGCGSNLIYTNSANSVPTFTVLLRKASGAGYYAMAGMPYEPVVQLSTPITRQSVMEGRTLAIAAFNTKLDDDFEIAVADLAERAKVEAGMRSTGVLLRLGREATLVVPEGAHGIVVSARPERVHAAVGYGDLVLELDPSGVSGVGTHADAAHATSAGLVVRATQSGRLYRRAAPSQPPFVDVGALVELGTPLGLIEVMKTFSHVVYRPTGGLPARARITRIVAAAGAHLAVATPLLEVEPA